MLKGHPSYIKTQKYTFQAFHEVGEGIVKTLHSRYKHNQCIYNTTFTALSKARELSSKLALRS